MLALFRVRSLQELRRHPWQSAAAACAVMLGVALAFGVHTINASALEEFAQALRAAVSDFNFSRALELIQPLLG